jgi:hypothetical protein
MTQMGQIWKKRFARFISRIMIKKAKIEKKSTPGWVLKDFFFVHFFTVPASVSIGAAVFVFCELVLAVLISCSWSLATRPIASSFYCRFSLC